ncbi:MAG: response regulator transcription factor [Opitutaceae bacterium]|nr:response regulator transcription factor [Opitutaceae bacterium]
MNTVILADDHEVVRRGVRSILEADGAFKVVAEVADGLSAVQEVEKRKPTLLFLDLSMPRLHGLEVLRQVRASSPQTKVLVLSMHHDEPYVIEALRAGAMAYILKGSESTEIARAVQEVVAGRRYLSAPLSERAIAALTSRTPDQSDPLNALTPREREVLLLAAVGLGTAEMAEKLFISPRTAETHRANLMQKLGLQSQTDLVRFAIRRGLIEA